MGRELGMIVDEREDLFRSRSNRHCTLTMASQWQPLLQESADDCFSIAGARDRCVASLC
jgi:hypothetical protein